MARVKEPEVTTCERYRGPLRWPGTPILFSRRGIDLSAHSGITSSIVSRDAKVRVARRESRSWGVRPPAERRTRGVFHTRAHREKPATNVQRT